MKPQLLKTLFLLVVLVSVNAHAHDADGGLPLPASASSLWYVTCSDDGDGGVPNNLEVSVVNNTKSGPMVSLQIITTDTNRKFFNIADPVGGDNQASNQISTGSGGDHYVLINKASSGTVSYHFTYHCMGPYGHTGTEIQQIQ